MLSSTAGPAGVALFTHSTGEGAKTVATLCCHPRRFPALQTASLLYPRSIFPAQHIQCVSANKRAFFGPAHSYAHERARGIRCRQWLAVFMCDLNSTAARRHPICLIFPGRRVGTFPLEHRVGMGGWLAPPLWPTRRLTAPDVRSLASSAPTPRTGSSPVVTAAWR